MSRGSWHRAHVIRAKSHMLLSAGSTQDTPSSRHGQIGPQKEELRVRAGYHERVRTFKACSTPAAPYKPQFPDALSTCALCNNGKACFQKWTRSLLCRSSLPASILFKPQKGASQWLLSDLKKAKRAARGVTTLFSFLSLAIIQFDKRCLYPAFPCLSKTPFKSTSSTWVYTRLFCRFHGFLLTLQNGETVSHDLFCWVLIRYLKLQLPMQMFFLIFYWKQSPFGSPLLNTEHFRRFCRFFPQLR
jgi:hypothetical protein